jgi:hypothetical protein
MSLSHNRTTKFQVELEPFVSRAFGLRLVLIYVNHSVTFALSSVTSVITHTHDCCLTLFCMAPKALLYAK